MKFMRRIRDNFFEFSDWLLLKFIALCFSVQLYFHNSLLLNYTASFRFKLTFSYQYYLFSVFSFDSLYKQ